MAAAKAAISMLLACIVAVQAQTRDLQAVSATGNYQLAYNRSVVGGDPLGNLPLDDPRLQRTVSGLAPEQIHLTYVSDSAVTVSWATGASNSTNGVLMGNVLSQATVPASNVMYGKTSGTYTSNATAPASNNTYYTQIYSFANANPNLNYSSPIFHHVTLQGLTPNTTYYYKVGDPANGMSPEFNFTSAPRVGNSSYPFVLGVVADIGLTPNTTVTVQHLADAKPQVWTLIGDLTYADDMQTNGTTTEGNGSSTYSYVPSPEGTYQPWWDMWYRYMQTAILSKVPFLPQHGNHELEPQYLGAYFTGGLGTAGNSQFQAYIARNPVPHAQSGSSNPLYYSVNVGPAHMIYLTSYDNFTAGSDQYNWLVSDLAKFNRTSTPWLLATFHAPWYSSFVNHYKENECMRLAMEELLYNNGVDVILNGHCHEYERSNPVYNFTVNQCGPVHITMGDGGNIEGLNKVFADTPGACPTPNATVPKYQPGGYCPTYVYDGQFCTTSQPAWSAFRESAFGHGILTFQNNTHALWNWNRNIDSENVISDSVYLIRQLTCPNKASYAAGATGATATAG